MKQWIWQTKEWPSFKWDKTLLDERLKEARFLQGKLLGIVSVLDAGTEQKLTENTLLDEMITTSAIEGEVLDLMSVRSSISNRLHIEGAGLSKPGDRYIEGLLDIMLDAAKDCQQKLTIEKLYGWQAALFPTGYSGIRKINVGELRGEGEMKIISGLPGKETIHYIAPPQNELKKEFDHFITWFNNEKVDGILKAGIAHLWFEVLHPFDDGNGRVGRALIDMALAQDDKLNTRYYSLSKQIMNQRKSYYQILQQTTQSTCDITDWLLWFVECYIASIKESLNIIDVISMKHKFWQKHCETPLNKNQIKVLNHMLDEGVDGFEGGITNKKYMHLAKTSRATAYRDLLDLIEKNCIQANEGKGRNSSYKIT